MESIGEILKKNTAKQRVKQMMTCYSKVTISMYNNLIFLKLPRFTIYSIRNLNS